MTDTTPVQATPETTYNTNGHPLCSFCDRDAVSWEALLRSTGGQFPRHYRCREHSRHDLAPGTVSGNITAHDLTAPA